MTLGPESFGEFHAAIHGYPPFAWQQRLLEEVVSAKRWPEVLDLPTGAGKTTCLDIALFALAVDASEAQLWCPRRIAMVVDRRVVVDQIAERGRKLAAALRTAATPIVREVANRLLSLSNEEEPLGVFTLRGGMPKDDGWARTPDQPLILASTVDQLGSRLLMQGYGVSPCMAPINAGLLANDTLVLLDEVHLSEPFAETLSQLDVLRQRFGGSSRSRFHHAFLSATPASTTKQTFRLMPHELEVDAPLAQRLGATKKARLVTASGRLALEKACVDEALSLLDQHRTLAVVLNRVASASIVARQLKEWCGETAQVVLLTGRMRPLDRDDALRSVRHRIAVGRERTNDSPKLIIVATQCIEAGADFDFDALVTEAASLAALRQRFGRVDRLGLYRRAEGVIVHDKTVKEDPVYGDALLATWKWLEGLTSAPQKKRGVARTIDFGVLAMPAPEGDAAQELLAPRKHAPILLPAYLDLWSQTNPAPAVVPDLALFLHGPKSGPADVQIIWRADLDTLDESDGDLLATAEENADARAELIARVGAVRPSALEALSLPFVAARRWLGGSPAGDFGDVEGEAELDAENRTRGLALRWAGAKSEVISATELRPGDTIIVPATRGGLKAGNFDPTRSPSANRTLVVDLAERAALFGRGQVCLRLSKRVLAGLNLNELSGQLEDAEFDLEAVREALDAASGRAEGDSWPTTFWLAHLAKTGRLSLGGGSERLLIGKPLSRSQARALTRGTEVETVENGIDLTTDEEDSVFAGRSVPLLEHCSDVEHFAHEFGRRLKLPQPLQDDLSLSGWLHDIGKADRRFQVLLRGGDEIELMKDERPWAKSGLPMGARALQRRAREASNYPRGGRHEVQSLAMLTQAENLEHVRAKSSDLELVLHLVASHHGFCRPLAPPIEDPNPIAVALPDFKGWTFASTSSAHALHRLDSEIPGRFWNLQRRLGWFELCWLEAILRLADHRASEAEQREES